MAKKIYVGVEADVPIYDTQNVSITASNISTYFTVTNGSYYFKGGGGTFTTNNQNVNNSTAKTTLTAKKDIHSITFEYAYSTEVNYDKFTLTVAGVTVENGVSGDKTGKWSGSLKSGDAIVFQYVKDSSSQNGGDQCTFFNMKIVLQTQTGTEKKSFATEVKKAFIGVDNFEPRELPAGYTQVEYIESNGTQYIDTGFMPNQDTRVVVDIKILDSQTTEGHICSVVDSSFYTLFFDPTQPGWYGSRYANGGVRTFPSNFNNRNRVLIEKDKNITKIGDVSITETKSAFQSTRNLPIFCRNANGTLNAHLKAKLYSCKIYDNGALIRDFVPCRNSSGVVGLYDLVGKRFYQNAGTGTFIAGSAHISTAMKVKKAYIGIAGVARLFFGSGEIKYLKQLRNSSLDTSFNFPSPGKVGKYAVFASNSSSYLVVYDDMLTSKNVSVGVQKHALGDRNPGETIGNLLLFAPCSSGTRGNETLVINDSLTVLNSPQLIEYSYGGYRAENKKQWVINAGGQGQAINQSMTLQPISALTSLSNSLYDGTRAGTHAVFFGSTPYAVSQSLTLTKLNYQMMSSATGGLTLNDKAIFIEPSTSIFVTYDSSLTYTQLTVPNVGKPLSRNIGSHGVLQDKLILSCDDGTAFGICNESFTYEYKVRGLPTNKHCAMATNEKYAFWGGGLDDNGYFSEKITVLEMS